MSPDDLGVAKKDLDLIDDGQPQLKLEKLKNRARQNVVLELGYFMGKLGRDKVALLYPEELEPMTDIQGIVFIKIEDKNSNWQKKLKQEIEHAFGKARS